MGADVNINTSNHEKVVHLAVVYDRLDLMDMLLKHGGSVGTLVFGDATVLHVCKSAKMAKKLLDNGANITTRDPLGNTVLTNSVIRRSCKADLVTLLLNAGVDYRIRNHSGGTAFRKLKERILSNRGFKRHVYRAEAIIEYVNSNVPEDVQDPETVYIRAFGDEIRQMKTQNIGDSEVSVWRMVYSNTRKVARLLNNNELSKPVSTEKFPSFSGLLRVKMYEGADYKQLETITSEFLNDVLGDRLPSEIIDLFIGYLSWSDMNILKRRLALEQIHQVPGC